MNHFFIVSCNALLIDEEETRSKILQTFVEDILRVFKDSNETIFNQICEMIKSNDHFFEHIAKKITYSKYNNDTIFFVLNFDTSFFSDENEEVS